MKKKITIIVLVVFGLFLGLSVLGAVIYERAPSGYFVQNPVSFNVSFDDWVDTGLGGTSDYWGISVYDGGVLQFFSSACVASTTKSQILIETLPISPYQEVSFEGATSSDCSFDDTGEWLEYNAGEVIFEVKGPLFEGITIGFVTGTLAYIGQTVSGLGPMLYLIIGIPLGFYVVRKVIALIPKK